MSQVLVALGMGHNMTESNPLIGRPLRIFQHEGAILTSRVINCQRWVAYVNKWESNPDWHV